MKRFLLLMICLLCCLTLTACYQDNDPWPANTSPELEESIVFVTATPSPVPVILTPPVDTMAVPTEVPATAEPAVQETIQPERTPGGNSDPGING